MIYAVDIGSTIPQSDGVAFAWCKVPASGGTPSGGTCPEELVRSIGSDLTAGRSVALGLEAPLFIPVPSDKARLSRRRDNEGNRSWAAPAGGYVAVLALHQAAWILRELRETCGGNCEITADPRAWRSRKSGSPVLFCWEAFVSGAAHRGHAQDAATAAMYFQADQDRLISAVTAENPLSLFGAAVLWSGWSSDLRWLQEPFIVLRPDVAWEPR